MVWVADAMIIELDSKKKMVPTYQPTRYVLYYSFVFLCFICYINIIMIPCEDTKITSIYDPTFGRVMFTVEAGVSLSSIGFLSLLHFNFSFIWYQYFSLLLNFRDLIRCNLNMKKPN